jgi:hypothetical protein
MLEGESMENETGIRDLKDRLDLIETMIAEGRRNTESWGWVFLLWGVAYYVAIAWANWGGGLSVWGHSYTRIGGVWAGLAWPITMLFAILLTLAIGLRKGRSRPATSLIRAIASIWISVGIAMLLLFPTFAVTGRLDEHSFVAIVAAMLGIANCASGMILRWKAQIGCAVVWWIAAVIACFGTIEQPTTVFLVAVFLCQIVFGIYAMILESRRSRREIAHA